MCDGQLSGEEQPLASSQAFDAASMTASDLGELELPTHRSRLGICERATGRPRNLTFAIGKVVDGEKVIRSWQSRA